MISACIITKNECDNLNICLERLSHYPFEIVVIDTGSTDDTKKVAAKYTSCIYDFTWCNDFSAARNFAISKATKDYILMIDTDEFVDSLDYDTVLNLIQEHPDQVGRLHRKNLFESDGSDMVSNELINRLFPKKLYHYAGTIHEQVVSIENPEEVYSTYVIPLYCTHVGYQGGQKLRLEKANRNLSLLLKEHERNESDTYILYQIGKAYYYIQEYEKAIIYFEKAMDYKMNPKLTYVNNLISTYAYCLINTKQFAKGLMLNAVYEDFSYSADFMFVMGLIYMYNARFEDAIKSFLDATTIKSCDVEGVNSYLAYYNIGVIWECLGSKEKAISYYKKSGTYSPATEGIKRCLS